MEIINFLQTGSGLTITILSVIFGVWMFGSLAGAGEQNDFPDREFVDCIMNLVPLQKVYEEESVWITLGELLEKTHLNEIVNSHFAKCGANTEEKRQSVALSVLLRVSYFQVEYASKSTPNSWRQIVSDPSNTEAVIKHFVEIPKQDLIFRIRRK